MKQSSNEVKKVLKYFSIFGYKPTLDELYTFLPVKIDKNKLKYTPPQYSIRKIKDQRSKIKISQKKLNNWRFKTYIKILSLVPQIKLIGLSGSISMMNAKEEDDIDLFIITAKNRLFTGRLIALVLAQIFCLRRIRHSETNPQSLVPSPSRNKVCLNLFFDERNLKIPKFKQTIFVGHEVLQMKPIIVKDNIYEKFLEDNRWVFRLFPNASSVIPVKTGIYKIKHWIPAFAGMTRLFKILNLFGTWNLGFIISNKIERVLKSFQMKSINKHMTTEIITSSQLWFHPDDFEKKIKI